MIKRYIVTPSLMLALLLVFPASAQSEGLELEHSPNGKRALRLHEEKRAQLVSHYYESIAPHGDRFEQTCERHLTRYTALLDREMRALTRKGMLDEAAAVQAAMKQVENLTISPPNSEGLHFLSKVTLEVKDNEKATKYGVDLLVNVQSAAEAYTKQTARALEQYKINVNAARQLLQTEMAQIIEQEQRAGRLEAVQETRAALKQLKTRPDPERPELAGEPEQADLAPRDETGYVPSDVEIPEALGGYYLLKYTTAEREMRESIVEVRNDGTLIRGQFYYKRDRTLGSVADMVPVKASMADKNVLVLQYEENTGRDTIVKLPITRIGNDVFFNMHTSTLVQGADAAGVASPVRCSAIRMGNIDGDIDLFEEGLYTMELVVHRDPEGNARGNERKLKLLFDKGTFLIDERTNLGRDSEFQPIIPIVFRANTKGMDVYFTAVYNMDKRREMFVVSPPRRKTDKTLEVRLWWNSTDQGMGKPPDATGTLIREEQ